MTTVTPPRDLTPSQWAAVDHFEGPLLVLAGPGSGKTRVITRRIVRLTEKGVHPSQILAITFTNKASREMAERVQRLLPGSRVWVSTFHKFCARILRQFGSAVGLKENYSIFDESDRKSLLRDVVRELDLDSNHFSPARVGHRISAAKNRLETPEMMQAEIAAGAYQSVYDEVVLRVYTRYQQRMLESNAVDFDDLLLHVAGLLKDNEEIRSTLDHRFRFVLVDEYQDTNLAQYQIVHALSQELPNLCATGDPDQSIYGWRGAEIGNILRFEHDFPSAKIVRLEQNYRSTKSILAAADQLIAHNTQRKAKQLLTDNPQGPEPELLNFVDQLHEADGIAMVIRHLVRTEKRPWSDFAVFYRVNALSREIELAFSRQGIPYQVAAGLAFYERAEVKDLLAYLRLVQNPQDRAAFLRVVNTPARGLGATSQERLLNWADEQGCDPLTAAAKANEVPSLSRAAVKGFQSFARMFDELSRHTTEGVQRLLQLIIDRSRYTHAFDSGNESDMQRQANVNELLNSAQQFDQQNSDDPSLEAFLEASSLASDSDGIDETAGKITLMTLHAAKGLEFPVVFLAGVEHGLLPHERSLSDNDPLQVEEERRLMFVGITRAMQRLYLTNTLVRQMRGQRRTSIPSSFLREAGLSRSGRGSGSNSSPLSADAVDEIGKIKELIAPYLNDEHDNDHESNDDFNFGNNVVQNAVSEDADPDTLSESSDSSSPLNHADEQPADALQQTTPPSSLSAAPSGRSDKFGPRTAKPSKQPVSAPKFQLTTGAAMLRGAASGGNEASTSFSEGMKVRHPRLGVGTIVQADGVGKWRTVTVRFDEGSQQTFIAIHSPLQPIGVM